MPKLKPEILFEDEQLIVANKPPGLLSIPDRFALEKPNLLALLTNEYGKVWTVHRIDRETCEDWGWKMNYNLQTMAEDMIVHIREQQAQELVK